MLVGHISSIYNNHDVMSKYNQHSRHSRCSESLFGVEEVWLFYSLSILLFVLFLFPFREGFILCVWGELPIP